MNPRRCILLAALVAGIFFSCVCAAAPDSPAVEKLKRFLSTPPIVESVVFSERQPPDPQNPSGLDLPLSSSQSFRFYEGRFQRDAFLLRELRSADAVSNLSTTGLLAAFDGTASWFFYGPNSQNRIIDFGTGITNEVRDSAYVSSYTLRQLLMLGIMRSTPGSVAWDENKFRVMRSEQGVTAWGDLQVLENGTVDALNVTYRLDSGDVHWQIRYAYGESTATGLPSGIRCFLIQNRAEIAIAEFRIYELRLSPQAMSMDVFRPEELMAYNKWQTLVHSNNAIYLVTKDGTFKRLNIPRNAAPTNESHLAQVPGGVYAAWGGANISIFILAWRMRATGSKNKNKNKNKNL